ncbi:MAG: endonuclease/exonuclease/phosphatase family protein [Thiobacillus sp.]|jgi:endonuclease/exonuclease/phosphatase (EEP) superfamily protein YafD|nr:endonuclease/exonuclease/phosphatase family protein [Thiobacillus sp.]
MRDSTSAQGFPARFHRYLDKRARWFAPICAFGLTVPIISDGLAGSEGTLEWLVDLASHWQWLYLVGLVLACAIVILNDRRWALWLLAMPLAGLTASSPALNVGHEPIQDLGVLTIVSANVNLENRDSAVLIRWLSEAKPDVVVLLEVSPEYVSGLDSLSGYPFRHLVPRHDPFGIAVLSRFPFSDVKTIEDKGGREHIESLIDWKGQPVRLTAWHPMPPISPFDHTLRNQQLLALAKAAKKSGQPAILAGDLNATPWSNAFSGLDQAGLRRATGLTPTWPAIGYGWVGIPIDSVLVTPQWTVVEKKVGPNLGSDHLPVIVRIALRKELSLGR